MEPVKPVTSTNWYMYKQSQRTYVNSYGLVHPRVEEVPCTFEEALDKAQRERELINSVRKKS